MKKYLFEVFVVLGAAVIAAALILLIDASILGTRALLAGFVTLFIYNLIKK